MILFIVRAISLAVLTVFATTAPAGATAAGSFELQQPSSTPITPADAAPFIGEWTLDVQGANGPATITLVIKVDNDKVAAEIGSDQMPVQPVTEISKRDKSLVLSYSFDYQGTPVPCVVTLTPAGDKTNVDMDFANGAYQMGGTATKKEKSK